MPNDVPSPDTVNVNVRSVPAAVHHNLQLRAKQAHQSLQEYLLDQLTRIASRPTMAEVLARAAANRQDVRVTKEDILSLRDEDRTERDAR